MSYVVAIPSYNRSEEIKKKTLQTLHACGVNKNNIYIFVANNTEKNIYTQSIPKNLYNKIIVGKPGIRAQRIFIVNYFPKGARIVSADDDVEGLYSLKAGGLVPLKDVDKFFKDAFKQLTKEKLYIWGIYPVRNAFFMKDTVTTDLKFIIGTLYGFINRKLKKLEPTCLEKEDYEQSILYYRMDGGVLRYNNVTIKTKFHAKGGLGIAAGREQANKAAAEYLSRAYPEFISTFQRKDGRHEVKLKRQPRHK